MKFAKKNHGRMVQFMMFFLWDGKIVGFLLDGFEQLWKFEWENNPCIWVNYNISLT